MEDINRFYITTPIYYVNDKPHIGHAYTTILADVLSRFHRIKGDETFFLTGVDEHGQKVQQAAEKAGIDPQMYCDQMVVHFQNAWEKLKITNDFFIRTTFDFHKKAVQRALNELYQKGDIYEAEYGGYYCIGCERFYTQKELVDGKCPQHLKEPDYIMEKNYFFRMGKYQEWLIEYIELHPKFIQPESRKNEVLGFLRNKLDDLCISRPKSRLKWGIELPFDKDYVTYVWFDALLNYVTAVGYGQDEERFKKWWPADYHLIGKDIVTTHCVYWPTMLKALDLPLPKTIFAHGWWLVADTKMSKSLKNIIQPLDLIDTYGVDPIRYYLMRDMMLGQDANFSEEMFVKRYNSELANDFGNLASRILTLIKKNFDALIPEPTIMTDDENTIVNIAKKLLERVNGLIDDLRLNEAIDEIITFVRLLNKYMETRQPWQLVKIDKEAAGTTLYTAAEGLRIAAILLQPIMPEKISILLTTLPTEKNGRSDFEWGKLKPHEKIGDIPILFPRIDVKKEPQLVEKEEKTLATPLITIDDFSKVKLVTAKVIAVERVEKSDKLLKLSIDTGKEKRQIVAGIAQNYAQESIVGKTVVIVANLQPAKIFGIESQGMLLAAKKDGKLTLITVSEDIAPGASIE